MIGQQPCDRVDITSSPKKRIGLYAISLLGLGVWRLLEVVLLPHWVCNNCVCRSWYSSLAGGNWLFICLAGGFYLKMVLARELGVVGGLVRDI